MLNKVMIIGHLGRDPELRYTQSGTPVATLNIATDESYVDKDGNKVERTDWHRVVVFQRSAENCSQYLSKGSLVYVEGKLQTRKWQDQQGQDRYSTEIKADRVQFWTARAIVLPAARPWATIPPVAPHPAAVVPSSSAARRSSLPTMRIWVRRFRPKPAAWTIFLSCLLYTSPSPRD